MRADGRPRRGGANGSAKSVAAGWGICLPIGAVFGFAYAFAQASRREAYDLRTPAVLLLDAAIAAGVAIGYALITGGPRSWARLPWCLLYGAWAAALFSLVDMQTNEDVLWDTRLISPDVPYVLLFAVLHGGIVVLLSWPLAGRALGVAPRPGKSSPERAE
jgi:hypothetical protein